MDDRGSPDRSPLIGIWWDDGTTLVALTHHPTENFSGEHWIDSNLNHAEEWGRVGPQFGLSYRSEYFSIPRGRVLLNRRTGVSIIYRGAATDADRLRLIAAEYCLNDWDSEIDEHYQTGPDADALFDDIG